MASSYWQSAQTEALAVKWISFFARERLFKPSILRTVEPQRIHQQVLERKSEYVDVRIHHPHDGKHNTQPPTK